MNEALQPPPQKKKNSPQVQLGAFPVGRVAALLHFVRRHIAARLTPCQVVRSADNEDLGIERRVGQPMVKAYALDPLS